MNAFEIVTIAVGVIAGVLALTPMFRIDHTLQGLGRQGSMWFDHAEDVDLSERPSEDERDAVLPKRPLRGRPS